MSCPKTLLKAVTAGRTRQVRLLLELGACANDYDDCGQTPLMKGVFLENDRNRDKIVKMLLKRGAIVSRNDVVGRNALMWACIYGRDNEASLLVEYADVDMDYNAVDINGQTALFHAVASGNAATVKLIVQALNKYDLSVDIPDSRGVTPLMQATRLGHDVCESILVYEGRAKVGLGDTNHVQFARKEKWAISSLRERSKAKKNPNPRQSQFPPIASGATDNKRSSRRQTIGRNIMDSETEGESGTSTDDDSYCLINNSFSDIFASENVTSTNSVIKNCLQNIPHCKIPQSLLAPTSASATDITGSGDESEVDSVASTIVEGKPLKKMPVDLSSMYSFKQEQMSGSYRQAVVKTEEPGVKQVVETDSSNDIKDAQAKKWLQLKKGLRLTGISKLNRLKNPLSSDRLSVRGPSIQVGDSTDIETRQGVFPSIDSDKKVHLVQASSPRIERQQQSSRKDALSEKNRNYSEI